MSKVKSEAIHVLTSKLQLLPEKDRDFAASLATQYKSKGWLSPKQWAWVMTLSDKVRSTGVPDFTKQMSGALAELDSSPV